jgi:hypothetical protein
MNMFKNLFAVGFLALGSGLYFTNIDSWRWISALGPDAIPAIEFLLKLEPFSTIICVIMAITLFMIGKQY